jgi:hypothetical protein
MLTKPPSHGHFARPIAGPRPIFRLEPPHGNAEINTAHHVAPSTAAFHGANVDAGQAFRPPRFARF